MSTNKRLTTDRPCDGFRLRPLARVMSLTLGLGLAGPTLAADGLTEISPFGTGTASWAWGISDNGLVVVGDSNTSSGGPFDSPFIWSNGTMTNLNTQTSGVARTAYDVSDDGNVVVGQNASLRAFRWSINTGTMTDLGTLGGVGSSSIARGVSADGSVVVGASGTGTAEHAFRWVGGTTPQMQDLGTLPGGSNSDAWDVSDNGSVVVGYGDNGTYIHAFRWVDGPQPQMQSLGTLPGGTDSHAYGVSANGDVVVGKSTVGSDLLWHAFRWSNGTMTQLDSGLGMGSIAWGVSDDGLVVVGRSESNAGGDRAFRWTSAGMQSVEAWLQAAGVNIGNDVTDAAYDTNSDGSVVVGRLDNEKAFIARVIPTGGGGGGGGGSGLITLDDVQKSLAATASGGTMALASASLLIHGAHGRPLARRVEAGRNTFWLAGDWGRDDHGARNGDLGLAEVGLGRNFGPAQVNVSLGQTWAKQNQALGSSAKTDGQYLHAEALLPVSGKLWASLGAYHHWGDAKLRRGYLNAGVQDFSTGAPDVNTWGLRARLEWDGQWQAAGTSLSPYADLSYSVAKLDAYTETGGGFPATFAARKDKATELRLGLNAAKPLAGGATLLGTLEAAHRFEKHGARTSGQLVGLFGFDLPGQKNDQTWLRVGAGVEGKLAGGTASLMLNATSKGSVPSAWLAANWQRAF